MASEGDTQQVHGRRRPSGWVLPVCCAALGFLAGVILTEAGYSIPGMYRSGEVPRHDSAADPEFRFMLVDEAGRPASWNPCEPIRVVVNLSHGPDGALDEVEGVLDRIERASDFRFEVTGTVSDIPRRNWPLDLAGEWDGWPPLVIAFAERHETDLLDGTQAAIGGADRIPGPDGPVYVSGSVVVDTDRIGDYRRGFGPRSLGGLLLHETLHALGLDHTSSTEEVMYPLISAGPGELGKGDRAGLVALTASGCRRLSPPG